MRPPLLTPRRPRVAAPRGGGRGRVGPRLARLPLGVLIWGVAALAMLVPAAYAFAVGDEAVGRAFLQFGLASLLVVALVATAITGQAPSQPARTQLLALVSTFAALPLMLAVPVWLSVETPYARAWIDMVSAVTTTGFAVFPAERLPDAVELWRALVGWLGGLFLWIAAAAILAPMGLGGFEIASAKPIRATRRRFDQAGRTPLPSERLVRLARDLAPIYAALTLALALLLAGTGERPLVAAAHAMSTMATSGLSPVGGLEQGQGGRGAEAAIALFLVFALGRATFAGRPSEVHRDPELRIAAAIVLGVTAAIFLRHYLAAREGGDLAGALGALWGAGFTALGFLTTAGWESADWEGARTWSGLGAPGLVLAGLAVLGGGVATTAGGVKLLRVFALGAHGAREIEKLVLPSSVGGSGYASRDVRRKGALIAWVFLMLFAFSVAAVTMGLAAAGILFEDALMMAIAALTNCGPLVGGASGMGVDLPGLPVAAQGWLAAGMVLGRMELLALIALLNPDLWRS